MKEGWIGSVESRGANWWRLGVLFAAFLSLVAGVHAAGLHFDRAEYVLGSSNAVFEVQLLLDMDDTAPGDQLPARGLFSMGAKVVFHPAAASVNSTNSIEIPAELNSNGLGGPAIRETGLGYAGGGGVAVGGSGYMAPLMLTVSVQGLTAGEYELTPALFFDSPRANFLDFDGVVLDDQITNFVASTVRVLSGRPRILSLWQAPGERVKVVFESSAHAEDDFVLEATTDLSGTPSWSPAAAAASQTLQPAMYAIEADAGSAAARWYRVVAKP